MDSKSHILFTQSLLSLVGKDINYSTWGLSPDIDANMILHRYWRHRISVIDKIYQEFIQLFPSILYTDKDVIALGITSHLYIDTFNGFVLPFEFTNPVWQIPQMFWGLLQNPIKNIVSMSYGSFPDQFYTESETIFSNTLFGLTTEETTATLVNRLSKWAGVPYCQSIEHITMFTNNNTYKTSSIQNLDIFEKQYTEHILKYL